MEIPSRTTVVTDHTEWIQRLARAGFCLDTTHHASHSHIPVNDALHP
jgi:hypothetical protein